MPKEEQFVERYHQSAMLRVYLPRESVSLFKLLVAAVGPCRPGRVAVPAVSAGSRSDFRKMSDPNFKKCYDPELDPVSTLR